MLVKPDFLVIDTEGKHELSEIAVIDSSGKLIYEAYNSDHPDNQNIQISLKTLAEIITDFLQLTQGKILVFHYAKHDLQVLKRSFQQVGQTWHNLETQCTCELAKENFPNLEGYSLDYLSHQLNLRVRGKHFNSEMAHTAKYDAEFTYQLYQRILMDTTLTEQLKNQSNPFSNSRVDTPFQQHPDLKDIYHNEFEILKSIILDIKQDPNTQSKGSVVIGEPGSGKTHLMMRLAGELLKSNRLLFIRQPNNPDTVLFHIYSRILESFVEPVPDSPYTQLEHLLAHSFVNFLQSEQEHLSKNGQEMLKKLENNHLSLFATLGKAGSQVKRKNWQNIEKWLSDWWTRKYSGAGYALNVIKGIIKYCSYTDSSRKELVTRWLAGNELSESDLSTIRLDNWAEDLSREAFALEAISVFSKLSLLDEPLIIVFDQLEGLGLQHNHQILLSFGEAIKEIFTHVPNSLIILNLFPDRWEQFRNTFDGSVIDRVSQYVIQLHRPSDDRLKQILNLKLQSLDISIPQLFTSEDLDDILNQPSIRAVINRAAAYYRHQVHGVTLPLVYDTRSQKDGESNVQHRLQQLEDDMALLKRQIGQLLRFNQQPETSIGTVINHAQNMVLRYLEEQQVRLEQEYDKPRIIDDNDDIGKLLEITEAFHRLKLFEVKFLRLGKRKIPEHILIQNGKGGNVIGFLQIDGSSFTSRIKNFNKLVISHKDLQFTLMRDVRQSPITGRIGKAELDKLSNTPNGDFIILHKADRVELELIYKFITDIHNRDLEVNLETALDIFLSQRKQHWLTEKLLLIN